MAVLMYHSGLQASRMNSANGLMKLPMIRPTTRHMMKATPLPSDRPQEMSYLPNVPVTSL